MNKKWIYGVASVVAAAVILAIGSMLMNVSATQHRLKIIEQTVSERGKALELLYRTEGKVSKVEHDVSEAEKRNSALSKALFELAKRVNESEKTAAMTTSVLRSLTSAIAELNTNTKELTKVVVQVAVMNERLKHLEEIK